MLDNGVFSHRKFAEPAFNRRSVRWGPHHLSTLIGGLKRKSPAANPRDQQERDALFTIGRLIREGTIEAFTYPELRWERFDQTIGLKEFDALAGCEIRNCDPAIERSRFWSGDAFAYVRKGGKRDRHAGYAENHLSQISFMEWLCRLDELAVSELLSHRVLLGLTDFEVESFHDIRCFQKLCKIGQGPENYPDMFHIWTAQRNRMDVFLTLETRRLPNIAEHFVITKEWKQGYPTKILLPSELLQVLAIKCPDPVPIDPDRFYGIIDL